jgi:hypothetical protein
MFITLTNASDGHKGNKILINIANIVTIYNTENYTKKKDGIIETVTYVFCPPHGTWEVEESVEEIAQILNEK